MGIRSTTYVIQHLVIFKIYFMDLFIVHKDG